MSFFRRFAWMFVSPSRVFDDIRDGRVGWVQAWLMLAPLNAFVTWLGLPIQHALMELKLSELTAEQASQQAAVMEKFGFVWVIVAPALVLLMGLITAGISYPLVTTLSQSATFKKYFAITMFADVVGMVGYLVTTAIVRMRGVESITGPDDARFSLSLRFLAPENSAVLKGLLGTFDFFVIWVFALVVLGLRRAFGMSPRAAVACIIPLWLIYAILAILGEKFGGMAG